MDVTTLIIGAGPAGLAIGGTLRQRNLPFHMVEKSREIGHSWRHHYDRLHLHTTKEESHLPGAVFTNNYPRYIPRAQYVAYLDQYAHHFDLNPELGVEINAIQRQGERWLVTAAGGKQYNCQQVVVATGFNRQTVIPRWPGMDQFQNPITHSRHYQNGAPFKGQNVLLVGMGNTGAELAIDLHEHGARPFISIRGPVNIVPRDIFGQPTARTALLLSKLPARISDPIGTLLRTVTVGDLNRYGIPTPDMPPAAQLRELGQTPVIDVGTIKLLKQGAVKVLPAIQEFGESSVTFVNNETYPFDQVILATGYRSAVADFIPDHDGLLNEHGHPSDPIGTGRFAGLYFIGFDGYAIGGVLRSIRLEAPVIANQMAVSS
ncbi:MAG: NAD(P)/FAD-dependent oxidoreductase [Anaerolineales bacterium]|nr:NAD(P)/FAD-dependent oxidoreductase [Anaerolineales bacterium]